MQKASFVFLAYYGGTAFEFNCSNSVETLGNVKHKYHVLGLVRASRQQPFVCGCSKQIAVRHRRTPRNGKWSGTKFTIPTKFPTFPRCMSTAIGFFPVADPRKILSNKKIQDQEAQTWIADRNKGSLNCWIQQVRGVMTKSTSVSSAQI